MNWWTLKLEIQNNANITFIDYTDAYIQEKKSISKGTSVSTVSGGNSSVNIVVNVPDMHLARVGKSASFKIIPQSLTGASI